MFGCLTRCAYADSRRNRSRISAFRARSAGRTFKAARRPWPFCSSASQMTPMPPSPSFDCRRNPPTTSPMLNGLVTVSSDRREEVLEVERPECLHHPRVEMLAALAAYLGGCLLGFPCLGVRARVRERVEVVGHDHHPAAHGDLLPDLRLGIARAIPALVM